MFPFRTTPTDKMRARLTARLRVASLLRASITTRERLQRNATWAREGLDAASSDPFVFRDRFGEDMPPHLVQAVALEAKLWQAVLHWVSGVARRWLTDEQFRNESLAMKAKVEVVLALLALEIEAIRSPLVRTYQAQLEHLQRRAA